MQLDNEKLYILNVGGIIHTTTLATLCRYPNSMLARMFTGNIPPSRLSDSKGNVFIDRDGMQFGYILNFLRSGILSLPENFNSFHSLEVEADFYGLDELIEALKYYKKETHSSKYKGYIIEIMEFEEASSFTRFYSRPGNNEHLIKDHFSGRNMCNSQWRLAMKTGGLLISGHKNILLNLPTFKVIFTDSGEYCSFILPSASKMEIFHYLSNKGWKLSHAPIAYGTDSDGSYIIREYIWQMPD